MNCRRPALVALIFCIGLPSATAAQPGPAPDVPQRLEQTLLTKLAGADRVRARTGGTCHRTPRGEKTIFEIKGREPARGFLTKIKLMEPDGVSACMCCGNPSFEIYRGDEIIATLCFHHSYSLRWSGGSWPGDIELTEASAAYLCQLLQEHDYPFPLARHEERIRRAAEFEQHRNACLDIITAEQFDQWLDACRRDDEDLHELVMKALPDAGHRTMMVYSLHGARPDASWTRKRRQVFDRVVLDLMKIVDPNTLPVILAHEDCPEQVMQGVARDAFGFRRNDLASTLPATAFEKLANWALRHPSEHNRRQTIDSLAEMNTPRAHRMIVRFLHQQPTPRPVGRAREKAPEKELFEYSDPNEVALDPFAPEPTGPEVKVHNPFIVPDGSSELVAAAIMLAQHGYPDALNEIRKLAAKTQGAERKALDQAATHLPGTSGQ